MRGTELRIELIVPPSSWTAMPILLLTLRGHRGCPPRRRAPQRPLRRPFLAHRVLHPPSAHARAASAAPGLLLRVCVQGAGLVAASSSSSLTPLAARSG